MSMIASTKRRFDIPALLAWFIIAMAAIALFSPVFSPDFAITEVPRLAICLVLLAILGVRYELGFMRNQIGDLILGLVAAAAAWLLIDTAGRHVGDAALGFWALTAATWASAWLFIERLANWKGMSPLASRLIDLAIPALFGATILVLWQLIVTGAGVPKVLLPAPSEIWLRLTTSVPILWADFQQTFMKAVLIGYVMGCGAGFIIAILVDRVPFLRRGLLPVGNLVSALPIIGVAPIMVMWFGFDWPSKAAVVIIMTFFPMLVNTVSGLAASDAMQRDLMRTYAANYWQTLFKLRLPMAMPFIFNALKINSTLALIGAIVAEFFGTPIVGMGFRISTEVGRMNVDMVWAEIAVAALAGSLFYGLIALAERAVTFWHPSQRG
ncbi:ABC transporter permease [Roseibium polysiphoniae]|uniref:ABC transporter permease n=1 Tax=Roseibium polysiphoniae TaxID=2571221 RepID=A0A944CBF5_9HYPH|nr:ABC transporter permease [Roseibium polysiphoniae]MBS8259430.1 ABC transporter permease [Roseibium polysiphoniae]